jgi:outer membrane protein OmpA-like peptidoglycan-associated protein
VNLDLEAPQLTPPPSYSAPRRNAAKKSSFWPILGLVVLLCLNAFGGWELYRMNQKVEQLQRQVIQAQAQSTTALLRASGAEARAQQAAQERNRAEAAQAQSQKAAQIAQQQAQAAQTQAVQANQRAAQYRAQREAELNQLQQALSQVAQTRRTAMGLIMTLDSNSIRFDFDKANLKPQYREVLSRIGGILSMLRGYRIFVYGYTDDIGTRAYNLTLSEKRAEAVRSYLAKSGLNPGIMTARGFGQTDPRVPGNSPQARAANRRVEIGIVDSTIGSPTLVPPRH